MFTTKKRTFNQHDNEKESFYKFSAPNFPDQIKLNENIYNLFLYYLHEEHLV